MPLRLEVLGFAGAAPLQAACPSYLVEDGSTTLLLDCGPGSLQRLWRGGLLGRLDAIVLSHMHMDHVLELLPLSGEIVREMLGDRRIELHVPRGNGREVLARLDAAFAHEGATETRFDAAFRIFDYDDASRLSIGSMSLAFAATAHAQPCYAARVIGAGRTLVYGADGSPSAALDELAAGADLLLLEATFAEDERQAADHGHMTAVQAGATAARAGAGRLLLTHLLADADPRLLRSLAGSAYEGPVEVARDGLVCVLD